jgi:hypothetical protein
MTGRVVVVDDDPAFRRGGTPALSPRPDGMPADVVLA